jgi:hypothetical protein
MHGVKMLVDCIYICFHLSFAAIALLTQRLDKAVSVVNFYVKFCAMVI